MFGITALSVGAAPITEQAATEGEIRSKAPLPARGAAGTTFKDPTFISVPQRDQEDQRTVVAGFPII